MNYYNTARALNSGAWLIVSLGNRSTGKSFAWKKHCVRNFLKNGERFIYLRRNFNDIELAIPTWFDDISSKFPGWRMEFRKNAFHLIKGKDDEKRDYICGYGFSLTTVSKLKSIPLSDVTTIFFDEFIPDDLSYLRKDEPFFEPELLLSLYMTVARGYKKVVRENVKLVCVANVVTRYSPYFSYFGVKFKGINEWSYNKDTGVYSEIIYNEQVANEIKASKAGGFIATSRYGQYALGNIALRDDDYHVLNTKTFPGLHPMFSVYANGWYVCLDNLEHNQVIFAKQTDRNAKRKYRLTPSYIDNVNDIPWLPKETAKFIRRMYEIDGLYYDSAETKSNIGGFFERNPISQKGG